MNDPIQPMISDYVEAALEASCDALIALEVVQKRTADPEAARRTLRAIGLTRRVINELRSLREQEAANGLSCGFVLASDGSSSRKAAGGGLAFS